MLVTAEDNVSKLVNLEDQIVYINNTGRPEPKYK